jgi:hypothetical protein
MAVITKQELEDAAVDAQTLEDVANGDANTTVNSRLGQPINTVAKAVAEISAYNDTGSWVTATPYAIKDLAEDGGVIYICTVAHTSGTFVTDLAAGKWGIFQTLTQFPEKQLSSYSDIATAVSTIGATETNLVIDVDATLTANLTIPSNINLRIIQGMTFKGAFTLTIEGSIEAGLFTVFDPAVTVDNLTARVEWIYPEWFGAIADADTGGGGTDSTVALQTAFDQQRPVKLSGLYLFSNLTIPPEKTIEGLGIHPTALISKTGSTGTAITDQGSAAKITLKRFAVYCRDQAYTAGVLLGYNSVQWGTEAVIDGLWVRDLPAGFPGIDINGNVGHVGQIIAQETGGIRVIGTANMLDKVESIAPKGFTEAGTQVAASFQDTIINAFEMEAPYDTVIPLYVSGNTSIGGCVLSMSAGTTHAHLIEIGASASTWSINNLKFYFGAGTGATITNGNIKSGSIYFGGNASSKNFSGEGNYNSGMVLAGPKLAVNRQDLQSFVFRLTNTGGTIQHRVTGSNGVASIFTEKINGAQAAYVNTPTGADASTAMLGGGKISGTSPSVFYFDTPAQTDPNWLGVASIAYNNDGTQYGVFPFYASIDINGETKNRLAFQLVNPATGAAVNWTSITSGKLIEIHFLGFLA